MTNPRGWAYYEAEAVRREAAAILASLPSEDTLEVARRRLVAETEFV